MCADQFRGLARLEFTGYEMEQVVPLSAASGALTALTVVSDEGPRLKSVLDGAAPAGENWLAILEAARRCLTADPPALLLVDDLQWVDELSRALLHYLLRSAITAGLPMVALLGTRPGGTSLAFTEALGRLLVIPEQFRSIPLEPLAKTDGVRLVSALSPGIDAAAADRIWQRCGGIPFWLHVVAKHGESAAPTEWQLRVRALPADPLELVSVLALEASPVDIDTAAATLEWTEQRTRAAADVLIGRGVAAYHGTTLRMAHDVVREAAVAALPDSIRRGTHRRIADHLQARPGSARETVQSLRRALAHRQAGGQSGADLAARLLRTGRPGLLVESDVRESAALADAEAAGGDRQVAHTLRMQVAATACDLGLPAVAVEQWSLIMLNAPTAAERARAALLASVAALEIGDRPRASALFADCRLADLSDPLLQIQRAAHESELHGDSTAAAEKPMRGATTLADRIAAAAGGVVHLAPEARHAYLAAHQAAYFFELRNDRPDGMLREAELMSAAAGTVVDRLRASLHRVTPLRILARYTEAESSCRSVRLAAVRGQIPALAFQAGYLLALCEYSLGELTAARATALDMLALADRAPVVIPSWLSAAWMHALIPEIDASLTGWAAARHGFEHLAANELNPHFRLHIRAAGAQWAARLGGTDDQALAAQWARDGAQDAELAGCSRCAAEHTLRSAEVFARIGLPETARELLARWDQDHGEPIGQARLWRARAVGLIQAHGHASEAAAALSAARSEAAATRVKLETVWCEIDLGSVLAATDHRQSVNVLRSAAVAAGRLGAVSEERRAHQLLRALGVRTWRPHRPKGDDTAGLTQRELSIAQMISDGASNPEIAEALFLSRKTVERHVSNVLAKTGARNRAELAARFAGAAR